ncbi:helix-turn-helix domain-containing protein [Reichenbachiella versicolor]|uniref:helix-turn-helix domain-containing protein n=1 Tax=Reichenbachiella versicolor TaxID=1821036 RepID=UPI000D6E9DBF|nr:helix-turn-helix transcriptional regulator [Reichenbachiella versicolor]
MLTYNFIRVLKARGIDKPYTFLKNSGFSNNFAVRISKNQVKHVPLKQLEQLCKVLHCTPDDLMEWIPEDETSIPVDHPLHKIKRSDKMVHILKTLSNVPLDKLDEIDRLIREKVEDK